MLSEHSIPHAGFSFSISHPCGGPWGEMGLMRVRLREHIAPTHPALTPTLTPSHLSTRSSFFIHHILAFTTTHHKGIKAFR